MLELDIFPVLNNRQLGKHKAECLLYETAELVALSQIYSNLPTDRPVASLAKNHFLLGIPKPDISTAFKILSGIDSF